MERDPRKKIGARSWVLWAVLVALAGSAGSLVGSQAIAHSDGQRSRAVFLTSSVEIASTLKLAIEREQDLAVNTGAFIISNPEATEAQFQSWVQSDRLFERYPELIGIGNVVLVPAAGLDQFAARSEATSGGAPGSFSASPPGSRPYYCFAVLTDSPGGLTTSPPNLDVCDGPLGTSFVTARDSGQSTYLPYGSGKSTDLAVGTAIYQRGVVPSTVDARRTAFLGWVGIQVAPHVLLATALQAYPHTAVAFQFKERVEFGDVQGRYRTEGGAHHIGRSPQRMARPGVPVGQSG